MAYYGSTYHPDCSQALLPYAPQPPPCGSYDPRCGVNISFDTDEQAQEVRDYIEVAKRRRKPTIVTRDDPRQFGASMLQLMIAHEEEKKNATRTTDTIPCYVLVESLPRKRTRFNIMYTEFAGIATQEFCESFGLHQYVNFPTRGPNTLDLIFSTFTGSAVALPSLGTMDHVSIKFQSLK